MKLLLIATLLMSVSAFAEEKGENFEKVKTAILTNIDQRINQIQAHKSCVQGASGHEALKACRKANKEAMKKLHMENKGERQEWKAGKEERREKRRADKKSKSN